MHTQGTWGFSAQYPCQICWPILKQKPVSLGCYCTNSYYYINNSSCFLKQYNDSVYCIPFECRVVCCSLLCKLVYFCRHVALAVILSKVLQSVGMCFWLHLTAWLKDHDCNLKVYHAGLFMLLKITCWLEQYMFNDLVYDEKKNWLFRAAWIDKCRPDVLITESTYATTIRDSKRWFIVLQGVGYKLNPPPPKRKKGKKRKEKKWKVLKSWTSSSLIPQCCSWREQLCTIDYLLVWVFQMVVCWFKRA